MLPVSRPSIGEEELKAVSEVFKTGWLGMGSKVKEFEDGIIKYIGAEGRSAVSVNTGTTALHLALDSIGLKPGDEVIVPSMTFVASIQAILMTGAVPVFCEIEENTMNISVQDIRKKLSSKTRAIMPVHYRGQPCDMDEIMAIARENNCMVVEDAAHAFGSRYKGRSIGSFGDLTCFSFDPIKNITCGEGGAVIAKDPKIIGLMQQKRILGIDKDTWSRYRNERSWFYDVVTQGYRYHMSNIYAAIGLEQLKKIDSFVSKKNAIAKRYDEAFRAIAGLKLLHTDYESTAMFTYIIRVENKRNELMDYLKDKGIGSGIHYIPSHKFSYLQKYSTKLPVTDMIYDQILTLPLYYDMTDGDVQKVVGAVESFFGR